MIDFTLRAALLALCIGISTGGLAQANTQLPAIQRGQVDLGKWDIQQYPAQTLSGQWSFFPDQLLSPEQLSAPDSDAVLVNIPSAWNKEVTPRSFPALGHGIGTYWLSLKNVPADAPLGLSIDRSCSNARIFFFPAATFSYGAISPIANIGLTSAVSTTSQPYSGSTNVSLPVPSAGTYQLLIQVSNFDFRTGGLCGKVSLGTVDALTQQTNRAVVEQTTLIAMIVMAGVYSLSLFMQQRRNRTPMWLMLTCFSAAIFFLCASGLIELFINSTEPWVYELRTKLMFASASWAAASMLMFYVHHFPGHIHQRWLKLNCRLTVLFSLFALLSSASFLTATTLVFIVYWGLQFVTGLWVLVRAAKEKTTYALPMLLAITPLLLAVPADLYQHIDLNDVPMSSLYCLVFFIFIQSQVIGHKFTRAFSLADRLSTNLKGEVDKRTAELNQQNQKFEHAQKALQSANNALKKLSITDGLTRVYNRMYFEQEFRKEWRRCSRKRTQISVLMIDADHFKAINDTAGHLAGDQALQAIAKQLHQHFQRAGELVARYGGEEFVVMLPETNQRKALAAAEGVRHAIEQLTIKYNNRDYFVTVSIGISTVLPTMQFAPDNLLEAADSALYEAKNSGRNRVAIIPLLPSGTAEKSRRRQYNRLR